MIKPKIQKKLLFPSILWERSINIYQKRGRILILGGSREKPQNILKVAEVISNLMSFCILGYPEGLEKIFKKFLPKNIESLPLPETKSGSISYKSLEKIMEKSKNADLVILGLDLSKNQETLFLIQKLIPEIKKWKILSDEGIETLEIQKTPINSFLFIQKEEITKLIKKPKKEIREKRFKVLLDLACKINSFVIWEDGDLIMNVNKKVSKEGEIIITNKETQASNKAAFLGILASFLVQNPHKIWEASASASYFYKFYLKTNDIDKTISFLEKEGEA